MKAELATQISWAVLSDEQMRKIWPFSLLNDEQMSNKVEAKHQPVRFLEECYFWKHRIRIETAMYPPEN